MDSSAKYEYERMRRARIARTRRGTPLDIAWENARRSMKSKPPSQRNPADAVKTYGGEALVDVLARELPKG